MAIANLPPIAVSVVRRHRHQAASPARAAGLLLAAGTALVAVLAGAAAPARGGAVLVSRETLIHAVGGPGGAAAFDLTGGTTDFGRFADAVGNVPPAGGPVVGGAPAAAVSEASQYSVPSVTDGGALRGAFAEGSVRSDLNAPGATASAVSTFDLMFRVTDEPVPYSFGAALGTTGSAAVTAELVNLTAGRDGLPTSELGGSAAPVFTLNLLPASGDSESVMETGLLAPGLYHLSVTADATGTPDESSAYYTANLTLSPAAVAVPLPPAAWPGVGALCTMIGYYGLNRWARRREWRRVCSADSITTWSARDVVTPQEARPLRRAA